MDREVVGLLCHGFDTAQEELFQCFTVPSVGAMGCSGSDKDGKEKSGTERAEGWFLCGFCYDEYRGRISH